MKAGIFMMFLLPFHLIILVEANADTASKGRDYFLSHCIGCHAFSCNRMTDHANAPKLGGLIGRKVGGVEDFPDYSEGFKNSKIVWNDETLDEFFKDPSKIDPNSLMVEKGKIGNAEVRKQIIAFLKTEDPTIDLFCPK